MSPIHRWHSVWLVASALLLAMFTSASPTQSDSPPRFVQEKPSRLKVKVKRIKDGLKNQTVALVELQVKNSSKAWAEPLEFEITVKDKKDKRTLTVARIAPPYGSRAGRAIAPGETLEYWVNVAAKPRSITKSGVKVVAASFFEDPSPWASAPVEVGELGQASPEVDLQGNRIPFSTLQLKNTCDQRVDAIFLAKFKNPYAGHNLVHCVLEPNQSRKWTIEGANSSVPGQAYFRGSEIEEVELVDWSVLPGGGSPEASKRLQAAYEARVAWPDPKLHYEGNYKFTIERYDWNQRKSVRINQTGTLTSEGQFARFTADPDSAKRGEKFDPMDASAASILLGRANRTLAREPFEKWLEQGQVRWHTQSKDMDVIAVIRPGQQQALPTFYWIEKGQIIGQASSPLAVTSKPTWFELETFKGATFIAVERARAVRDEEPKFPTFYEYEFKEHKGILLPHKLRQEHHVNPAEQSTFITLEISALVLK